MKRIVTLTCFALLAFVASSYNTGASASEKDNRGSSQIRGL